MKVFKTLPFHLWALGFFFINFDLALKWEIHGFSFKLSYALFLAAWIATLVERWRGSGFAKMLESERQHALSFPWLFPSLLVIYALAGAAFSLVPLKSFAYSFWLLFDVVVVAGTAAYLGRTNRFSLRVFYYYLAALILFTGGVIIVDQLGYYAGHVDGLIGFNQDSLLHWGVSRPHAFAGEPSYAAALLCLGVVFLLKEILFRREYLPQWLSILGSLVGFIALVFTTARSGWLSFAFTLILMLVAVVLHFRENIKRIGITFGAAVVIVIAFVVFTPSTQRKVLNNNLVSSVIKMKDGSGNARLHSMLYGWVMARETNFLGVGLGANYAYWTRMKEANTYSGELAQDEYGKEAVMSSWAQVLAELGITGVLLYLGFAISLISLLLKKLVAFNSPIHGVAVLAAVVFFTFSAHWLSNICRTDIWVWFAFWGVIARLDEGALRKAK